MTGPNARQLNILEHALGLAKQTEAQRRRYTSVDRCGRNHFVAGEQHRNWPDLVAMESQGLVRRHEIRLPGGPRSVMWFVTEQGFAAANRAFQETSE